MDGIASGPAASATHLANIAWAAGVANGFPLTLEVINNFDTPGYFIRDFDQAAAILTEINASNLGLQFDTYHAYRVTGDILGTWTKHNHLTTHIQIGGIPDRHEPDTGTFDYAPFLASLAASGYVGWVSGEYFPASKTSEGLSWLKL